MDDRYISSSFSFWVLAVFGGHIYRTMFGIGHSLKEIVDNHARRPNTFPCSKWS